HFVAVRSTCNIAMPRQEIGHAAHFSPAHGIRLTGERKRSAPPPPDLAGGQMQVDQRRIFCRSRRRLVEPLTVERKYLWRSAEPMRGLGQLLDGNAADIRDHFRRVLAHGLLEGVE